MAGIGPSKRFRRNGFRKAGDAAVSLLQPALARRGFADRRFLTDWPTIVGADLARRCRPVRLSHGGKSGYGGSLVLAVPGAMAIQIQHEAPRIMERVNAHFGFRAVSHIRIVQADGTAATTAKGAAPEIAPCPKLAASFAQDVSGIEDDGLRSALDRLGTNIAQRKAARAAASRSNTNEE